MLSIEVSDLFVSIKYNQLAYIVGTQTIALG